MYIHIHKYKVITIQLPIYLASYFTRLLSCVTYMNLYYTQYTQQWVNDQLEDWKKEQKSPERSLDEYGKI